jgi:hypothetical protein
VDAARNFADALLAEAIDALSDFGESANTLARLGRLMVHRAS